MSLFIASLYLLCLAFLFGSAIYVYSRDPFVRLNACFALLAVGLLGWVGTLFLFGVETEPASLLLLGRANFATAAFAAPAGFLFVSELAKRFPARTGEIGLAAAVFLLLSLFTPWIDKAETLGSAGEHITTYGFLFPVYVLHIVGFLLATLWLALRPDNRLPVQTRRQLRLLGVGILATTIVSLLTNAVLPYFFHDFRFIHWGTLSTLAFLLAIAYTVSVHRLFNIRVLIRKTLIFTLLITFALELYQFLVEFLTRLLPLGDPTERHLAAAGMALVINAVTHEPLRWWLEKLAQKWTAKKPGRGSANRRSAAYRKPLEP